MSARPAPAPAPPRTPPQQLRLPLESLGVSEALVESACNAEAAGVLARWPDGVGVTLALHGPAGSGKSRLAAAWAERVGAIALHGAEAALIEAAELEGRPVLLDRAQDADDESLFHLINLAAAGGGALLLVSRDPPRAWPSALPDLRSRLDAIRVVAVEARRRRDGGDPARALRRAQHHPRRRRDRLSGSAPGPFGRGGEPCGRTAGRPAPSGDAGAGAAGAGRRSGDGRGLNHAAPPQPARRPGR
ncbi:hypothetical protein MU852_01875 [Brevundimonas albigilva]|uniref:hypothetical protein n=1 Tax=Brevundimonas albigilva TaxID=1312364 RepID=UPI00201B7DE6|nr:hypothetical protein [Brevundimonas albigilva]UQV18688.1 hypothetical protein MU852_01875 [Brevundimonas albigilva]